MTAVTHVADDMFADIVAGIQELEELQAPGWFSLGWFGVGLAGVGLFYVGVGIT